MPGYVEDVLTRIINVQWGGKPAFVYGTLLDNALYYVKPTGADKPIEQQTIVPPGPGDPKNGLSAFGSSYHRIIINPGMPDEKAVPTFLVCGNRASVIETTDSVGNPVHLNAFHTMIYLSNDGLEWKIVRQEDGHPTWDNKDPGANPVALVWDETENAFFYDQNHGGGEQIFRSPTGVSWSDGGSGFVKHCADNDCIDEFGQNVPDGVMSRVKKNQMTAKPVNPPIINYANGTSSVSFASGGETFGSDKIEITTFDIPSGGGEPVPTTRTVSVPGMKKVFCVATSGNIVMAGGSPDAAGDAGIVTLSFDQGGRWQTLASRSSSVITMVAGDVS